MLCEKRNNKEIDFKNKMPIVRALKAFACTTYPWNRFHKTHV